METERTRSDLRSDPEPAPGSAGDVMPSAARPLSDPRGRFAAIVGVAVLVLALLIAWFALGEGRRDGLDNRPPAAERQSD